MQCGAYNLETWTNLSHKEEQALERIQKKILCAIYQVGNSTPYWGLLSETGFWPMMQQIHYKKMMLYQHILKSDNSRIAKQILKQQIKGKYPRCWYSEMVSLQVKYDIDISQERVIKLPKSTWKREIKGKICQYINETHANKESTKLRFTNKGMFKKQDYLNKLTMQEAKQIIRVRLNMIDAKENYKAKYGQDTKCVFCEDSNETTEHLFECGKIKKLIGINIDLEAIEQPDNMEKLKLVVLYINRVEQMKINLNL